MDGLNRCQLAGHLGQDPELKMTSKGSAMLSMRVAVTEKWKDGAGQPQERTEWFSVVVWGKKAEWLAKDLSRGAGVFVEGRLQTRSWETDGTKRYTTEVVADKVMVIAGRPRGERQREPQQSGEGSGGGDDDLPF